MSDMEPSDFDNIRWDETLQIHGRDVVAVEHPLIIRNLNKGIKTFGLGQPFDRVSSHTVHIPVIRASFVQR